MLDNNCMECHEGYKLTVSHKCVMNTTCDDGQFRALGVGDCEACHSSCYSCHGASAVDCTSCKEGRYESDVLLLCYYLQQTTLKMLISMLFIS